MGRITENPGETCMVQDEILSRRTVLRGALITGCVLIAPVTLLGACSKSAESSAASPEELPKADVKYQDQPKGSQKCSNCAKFNSANRTCQRVEGTISPDGWCVLWTRNA